MSVTQNAEYTDNSLLINVLCLTGLDFSSYCK